MITSGAGVPLRYPAGRCTEKGRSSTVTVTLVATPSAAVDAAALGGVVGRPAGALQPARVRISSTASNQYRSRRVPMACPVLSPLSGIIAGDRCLAGASGAGYNPPAGLMCPGCRRSPMDTDTG